MKRTAKRFGKVPGEAASAKAGRDSSHGRAMVTPAPRRTVRREMRLAEFSVRWAILFTFLFRGSGLRQIGFLSVQELGSFDYGFQQRSKVITIRRQRGLHALNDRFIGEQERPAESVAQQFTAEIIQKI